MNNKNSVKTFDPKDNLSFLKHPRETDQKRDSSERQIDFKEIYHEEDKAILTVNGNVRYIITFLIG
jgi:hypothetical protein